jgi:exopolysaccharide biosynthesis polyprenyl glycosylphosphotransferase
MIVTTSDQAKAVVHRFQSENEWEYQVTYLTILDKYMVGRKIEGIEVKADFMDMYEIAKQQVLDGVFIHIPSEYVSQLNLEETILEFENMGITVNLSINTFGLKLHEKIVQEMSGYHVLTFSSKLFNATQLHLKRLVDITGGLVGCFLTVIIGLFVAPAILIESPGPVFFSQIRVGKNGRRFRIYKFRSMYMDAEDKKLGLMTQNEMDGFMFIRKTSLDEFPQFFNILKGDMSLVGTRPPTEEEFLNYEGRHKRRLALKSGLTGLWQVSGRSDIKNFEEVVKMDLDYIDNWSLMMDIKILLKTIWVVLINRGSR